MILEAITWWFLVHVHPATTRELPHVEARGPYPSEEFCKLAGEALLPNERAFWPVVRVKEAEAREAKAYAEWSAEYEKQRSAAVSAAKARRGYKPGDEIRFTVQERIHIVTLDADGKETSWGTEGGFGSWGVSYGPRLSLVTPCSKMETPKR